MSASFTLIRNAASTVLYELEKFQGVSKKLEEAHKIGGSAALPDETVRKILLGSAEEVQRALNRLLRSVNMFGVDLGAAYRAARAAQREAEADGDPETPDAQEKPTEEPEDGKPGRPAAVGGEITNGRRRQPPL